MTAGSDHTDALCEAVRRSAEAGRALRIVGAGTKSALTGGAGPRRASATLLSVAEHRGILAYRPEELVVTARAGTPLRELEQALAEAGQYLPFEPPRLLGGGTLGGAIASGLAGPGRPWRGSVRDAVLGVELINGRGQCLRFGGQVMKNVAGYDVARLQVGAFGTLGLLLAVSVKVLPSAPMEVTREFEVDADRALALCRQWALRPLPITATCHHQGRLRLRLSGAESAVAAAVREVGGERSREPAFWEALRDYRLPFFAEPGLWRASLPPAAPAAALADQPAAQLIGWGGAERWWRPQPDPDPDPLQRARAAGGYARPFDATFGQRSGVHLDPAENALARRLRDAFDPDGVFNQELTVESGDAH